MRPALERALAEALGATVRRARPVAGGDINEAYALELDDGRRVFVKTRHDAPEGMYRREAEGLSWLRDAEALPVPDALAVVEEAETRLLALEWVEPGRPRPDYDEVLGRGLAALHASGAPSFGLSADNFIANIPQINATAEGWASFYGERRLRPMAERARALPRELRAKIDRLIDRLPELVGPSEAPARLHGDLWGGNVHTGPDGRAWLIDPAVYGGHREVDLAMMRLFGGFSARTFDAYEEVAPLTPGASERVPLYQLYPLLVHVALFGASYIGGVARAVERYG